VRWTDLNDSCGKNIQQENVSSPLEVRNRVSISSDTRMTVRHERERPKS
jgi:hypothetical protein